MVEFLAERFNYAVVIVLMMTGLYIVFSTGNLVKKLVGLSVFQTSVFLLYISVGKVAGGRPPILDLGHGEEESAGHGAAAPAVAHAAPDAAAESPAKIAEEAGGAEQGEAAGEADGAEGEGEQPETAEGGPDAEAPAADGDPPAEGDPEGLAPNDPDMEIDPDLPGPGADTSAAAADAATPDPAAAAPDAALALPGAHPPEAAAGAADAAHGALDTVYSNPLPHVLILTAIVVGVATLAVGLALVVRIRETYGVIEEDDLHRADLDLAAEPRA